MTRIGLALGALVGLGTLAGCAGEDGAPCTVAEVSEGRYELACPDGSAVTFRDGMDGMDGADGMPCTVQELETGRFRLTCPDGSTADFRDGEDAVVWIVRFDPVDAGPVCTTGGSTIHTGPDTDGNALLSNDEIVRSETVCNGLDGESTLVDVVGEDPGENCLAGGVVVRTGDDGDGDGTLDPDEVEVTRYVCNGLDGEPGEDGRDTTATFADEFPSTVSTYRSGSTTGLMGIESPGLSIAGDYVEQTFTDTGATDVSSAFLDFIFVDDTVDSCAGSVLGIVVEINDVAVGGFALPLGGGSAFRRFVGALHFPPVAGTGAGGESFRVRYEGDLTLCDDAGTYGYFAGGDVVLNP